MGPAFAAARAGLQRHAKPAEDAQDPPGVDRREAGPSAPPVRERRDPPASVGRPGIDELARRGRRLGVEARRRLALDDDIRQHDAALEGLVRKRAPAPMEAPGVSTLTIDEMLVVLGDNPERIRWEAAFAELCGVRPVRRPAARGPATASTGVETGGRTRRSAASRSRACAATRRPSPTSSAAPPRESRPAKSADARNAASPTRSSTISLQSSPRPRSLQNALDRHAGFDAPMESVFGSLKTEMVHHRRFRTRAEATATTLEYIEVY